MGSDLRQRDFEGRCILVHIMRVLDHESRLPKPIPLLGWLCVGRSLRAARGTGVDCRPSARIPPVTSDNTRPMRIARAYNTPSKPVEGSHSRDWCKQVLGDHCGWS